MSKLKFKYHGNYCGPNYCGSEYNPAECDFSVRPVDELDEACRLHDYSYHLGNRASGDRLLAAQSSGLAAKGNLKALPVAAYFRLFPHQDDADYGHQYPPPVRELVGIETNPGPNKKAKAPKRPKKMKVAASAPVAYRNPSSTKLSDGAVSFVHREFVCDVAGSVGFASTIFPINPASTATFKWLSGVAESWNNYLFSNLKFEYIGRCSSSIGGSVMMAVDFDSSDPRPTNKADLLNYKNAVSSNAWTTSTLFCDPKDLHKQVTYFMGTDDSSRQSYVGNMVLATGGQAGTGVIGELWVSYSVSLQTPKSGGSAPVTTINLDLDLSSGDPGFTALSVIGGSGECIVSKYAPSYLQFERDADVFIYVRLDGTGFSGVVTSQMVVGPGAAEPTQSTMGQTIVTNLWMSTYRARVYRGNLWYITLPSLTTLTKASIYVIPATYDALV